MQAVAGSRGKWLGYLCACSRGDGGAKRNAVDMWQHTHAPLGVLKQTDGTSCCGSSSSSDSSGSRCSLSGGSSLLLLPPQNEAHPRTAASRRRRWPPH